MGIGIQILLTLVFFGVLGLGGGAIYFTLWWLGQHDSAAERLRQDFIKVAVAGAIVVGIGAGLVVTNIFFDLLLPSRVYAESFGFSPPSDVTDLKGYRLIIGDGGSSRLEFRADAQTVDKIIRENGFLEETTRPTLRSDDKQFVEMMNVPGAKIYRSSNTKGNSFAYSAAFLVHDEIGGRVYFSWAGID